MFAPSLAESAYQQIRDRLARGELPPRATLSEPSLARSLGMSRTPVREAIRRLVFEGFLQQTPKKGTVVKSLDRDDVAELYELRELVEGHAAAAAAERMGGREIGVLEGLVQRMSEIGRAAGRGGDTPLPPPLATEFYAVDLAFHLMILRAVTNKRISRIASDSQILTRLFAHPKRIPTIRVVAISYGCHRRILRGIRSHDPVAAREAMWAHIRRGKSVALSAYQFGDQPAASGRQPTGFWASLPPDIYAQMEPALLEPHQ